MLKMPRASIGKETGSGTLQARSTLREDAEAEIGAAGRAVSGDRRWCGCEKKDSRGEIWAA